MDIEHPHQDNIANLIAAEASLSDENLYQEIKKLESEIEFSEIQEDYIKEEQLNLKREILRAKEEIKRIQATPLVIGQFIEMIDLHHGLVSSTSGSNYYVRVLSILDREKLTPNCSVALHRSSHSVVDILPSEADASIQMMKVTEKNDTSYEDIGGLDIQKQEIKEAIELPLTQADLYAQNGKYKKNNLNRY